MRSFVALPLPDATCDALCAAQAGLRVGRPVPPENLHLTLAFLDDPPDAALEALHEGLETLIAAAPVLRFAGLGSFGAAPRSAHARVMPDPALDALHRAVLRAARQAGIALPSRRFQPHVTLVRLRPADADGLAQWLAQGAGFRHVTPPLRCLGLYASDLRPDGARYRMLAQYPLRG